MPLDLITLLFAHALCNTMAETNPPLGITTAIYCSENFESLKVTLHPDLTVDQFWSMNAKDRARISVESYTHYKSWLHDHRESFDVVKSAAQSVVASAM